MFFWKYQLTIDADPLSENIGIKFCVVILQDSQPSSYCIVEEGFTCILPSAVEERWDANQILPQTLWCCTVEEGLTKILPSKVEGR